MEILGREDPDNQIANLYILHDETVRLAPLTSDGIYCYNIDVEE